VAQQLSKADFLEKVFNFGYRGGAGIGHGLWHSEYSYYAVCPNAWQTSDDGWRRAQGNDQGGDPRSLGCGATGSGVGIA